MGIIIIVLFAVFGYIFFNRPSGVPSEMDSWAGDQPACGSFYQCTFSHLIAGMMGDLSPMYTNDHGELWKYVPLAIQDSSWLQVCCVIPPRASHPPSPLSIRVEPNVLDIQ
jgi:hypothetical protein